MKKLFLSSTILTLASPLLLLSATTALAQQQQTQAQVTGTASGALEEVIVTAQYREERLQETPIAITAITAQDIEQRNFTEAYQISYTVPNLSLRPTQAAFGNTMSAYIRGIGQYDFLAEFEPGVGIYFDDVIHPVTMGSMVDLMDLERVEVLRGPQGTLFGRGAIGGAIRYISKKPVGDNTGHISVTYGQFNRIDIRGSYDFALSDTVFARVTGVSKQADGYQKVFDFRCLYPSLGGTLPQKIYNRKADCQTGTQGGTDVAGARGQLRWAPNDTFDLTLSAEVEDDNSEARADTLVAIARNTTGPFTGQLPVPFNFWSAGMAATYGVPYDERFMTNSPLASFATYSDPASGIEFKPVTAIQQHTYSAKADWHGSEAFRVELIGSYSDFESQFATDADGSPLGEQTVDGRQSFHGATAEVRFSGRAANFIDWTVGGFYYDGSMESGQQVSIPAFVPGAFLVNGLNKTDSTNESAFAHAVFDVTDKLSFTAGLRYSKDDKDEDFDNTIVRTTLSTSENHTDWKAGIDYKFTNTVMAYASAATGYRPQAFNPRPFQITQFVKVDGEEATSYEVGFKADMFDRRLRTNLAVFYTDYNQRILPVGGTECLANAQGQYINIVPPGTPGAVQDSLGQFCIDPNGPPPPGATTSRTFYQNIPATIQGAEIEIAFRPVEGLNISGQYGYTDFQGDEFDNPALLRDPRITTITSDEPIYVPKNNWSFSIAYDFGMGNGSKLTPRVDYYGQSKICPGLATNLTGTIVNISEKQFCSPAYELLNVRLEWGSPENTWQTAVGVNNVADEDYFLNKFDLTGFGQPTLEGQPGMPRNWYVQFTRNFQ
jgi:iron complex outermembrane recepter protein